MKKLFQLVFLFVFFPALLFGQTGREPEPNVRIDAIHHKIDIDFTRTNVVYNLLVHLNDSTGTTVSWIININLRAITKDQLI